MITTPFGYITFLFVSLAIFYWATNKFKFKVFKYVPPFVLLFLLFICFGNLGVFDTSSEGAILATKTVINTYCVPLLVFCVLVQSDARKILKLGPKMILTFLVTAVSIIIGISTGAILFHNKLNIPEAAQTFGALTGSFIGGPENWLAIANAVEMSAEARANMVVLVHVVYSPWVIFLMCVVPLLWNKFNNWVHADLTVVAGVSERMASEEVERKPATVKDLAVVLGVGLLVVSASMKLGELTNSVISALPASVMTYVYVTAVSMVLGVKTKLGRNSLIKPIGSILSMVLVMLTTLGVNLSVLKNAGFFFVTSGTALLIHVIIMVIYAKITKTDIFTLGCASIAAIGGNGSAPVVAVAYQEKSQVYVAIATIMAAMGSILGTFGGLLVIRILSNFM